MTQPPEISSTNLELLRREFHHRKEGGFFWDGNHLDSPNENKQREQRGSTCGLTNPRRLDRTQVEPRDFHQPTGGYEWLICYKERSITGTNWLYWSLSWIKLHQVDDIPENNVRGTDSPPYTAESSPMPVILKLTFGFAAMASRTLMILSPRWHGRCMSQWGTVYQHIARWLGLTRYTAGSASSPQNKKREIDEHKQWNIVASSCRICPCW